MIVKPNCKINLGLNVIRKRMDGYHDIETVFYPSGLCDTLEITASDDSRFHFSSSGLKIPGDSSLNLCIQAYELIREHFQIPAVNLHLQKAIPLGSGLGGGSSNAAFTLENIPAFAKGRGEVLEKVSVNLSGLYLLIVIPQVHMSTGDAYTMIQPARPESSLKEIITLPVNQWKGKLVNDFENAVCLKFPLICQIKDLLYEQGAVYSSMSGSGSAVYGLFNEIPAAEGLFPGCFVWVSSRL